MPPWRVYKKNDAYLSSGDLWDERVNDYRSVVVQIERVAQGEVVGEGGRKKGMPFVYFVGAKKPFGMNSTNAETVTSIVGSDNTDRWKGQWIELFVTQTMVNKERRPCIRVAPTAPVPPADKQQNKAEQKPPADAPKEPAQ